MYRKPSLFVLCSLLLLLSACISKSKYLQLEAEHTDAKHKLKNTETRLGYTEESREKCIDSLADCQGRFKEKEGEKVQLSQEMEELQVSLDESQSTIEQQTKVIRDLHTTRIKIESSLKEQIESQEIKLEEIAGKLKVTLVDKILFDTGKVEVSKRGEEVLLELADTLRENKDQNIVIEGHTDDVPIGLVLVEKYPTNWELSTARAVKVVRFLQEKGWLEPERLSATGYSYYKPVASNDTAEGRRQNRRIEIILVPKR
ncbi:MAG: OmpA family protein [Deltaproteobacteria bacterium]|nr:MAG: OmpA family protein [Deltaproteobacteria bacterium]